MTVPRWSMGLLRQRDPDLDAQRLGDAREHGMEGEARPALELGDVDAAQLGGLRDGLRTEPARLPSS